MDHSVRGKMLKMAITSTMAVLLVTVLCLEAGAAPQDVAAAPQDPSTPSVVPANRFTVALTLNANNSGFGTWMEASPSLRYDIHPRWSVEVGVPIYYLNPGSTASGSALGGPGDVHASLTLDVSGSRAMLFTTGSVGAATGSVTKGLGSGQTSWDWTTNASVTHGRLVPYATAGLSNNLRAASQSAARAIGAAGRSVIISNGNLIHVDAGMSIGAWRASNVSLSGYLVSTFGNQSVSASAVPRFRGLPVRPEPGQAPTGVGPGGATPPGAIGPGQNLGPRPGFGNVGNNQPGPIQAGDVADWVSDRGLTLAVAGPINASTSLALWVSKSLWYDYTAVSVSASVNLTKLLRKPKPIAAPP